MWGPSRRVTRTCTKVRKQGLARGFLGLILIRLFISASSEGNLARGQLKPSLPASLEESLKWERLSSSQEERVDQKRGGKDEGGENNLLASKCV